jgi:hypothetical protein
MLAHGVFSDIGTKFGTVSSLFSCSHPLIYRRRLAWTKGGILSVDPSGPEEVDVICKLLGSQVSHIVKLMRENL